MNDEKMSIFTPKISDDLSLFLVIDQVFQIFRIFTVLNVVCDLFFTRKATISEKNSLMTPFYFTLFVLSRAFDNTTSQNIGGRIHGPSPPQIFWGDRPPSPPRSPPLQGAVYYNVLNTGLVLANHGSIYMNNARF